MAGRREDTHCAYEYIQKHKDLREQSETSHSLCGRMGIQKMLSSGNFNVVLFKHFLKT